MPGDRSDAKNPEIKVRVDIDGDILTIRGSAEADYVHMLADEVSQRIARVREAHPNVPRHHVAILVALHLADELHRQRSENRELLQLLEEK